MVNSHGRNARENAFPSKYDSIILELPDSIQSHHPCLPDCS